MGPLQTKAAAFAKHAHDSTNHEYDGKPYYQTHIKEGVIPIAEQYIHLVITPLRDQMLAVGECHDVIEDCRVTFNDLKKAVSEEVAHGVMSLTNRWGYNRKQRAPNEYYELIVKEETTFIKLCDRLANAIANSEKKMLDGYREEYADFKRRLQYDISLAPLWRRLDEIFLEKDELNELKPFNMVRQVATGRVFVIDKVDIIYKNSYEVRILACEVFDNLPVSLRVVFLSINEIAPL